MFFIFEVYNFGQKKLSVIWKPSNNGKLIDEIEKQLIIIFKQTNNPHSTCDYGTVRDIPLTEAIILAQDCNTLGVLSKTWSTSSMGSSGLSLGAIEGGIRCSQKK